MLLWTYKIILKYFILSINVNLKCFYHVLKIKCLSHIITGYHRFLSHYQPGLVLDSLQTGSPGLGIQKKFQEDNAPRQHQDPLRLDLLFTFYNSTWTIRNQESAYWVC